MQFAFHKYQGTGNDFVMIDDRASVFPQDDTALIARCCDRRFGIGADGLILIQLSQTADFKMVYFNADGNESTLCGNGARCTVAFAAELGIIDAHTTFEAIDGQHTAERKPNGIVALRMHDVEEIIHDSSRIFLDTGSPHHIVLVEDLMHFSVVENGRSIRSGAPYFEEGTNVNFVEQQAEGTFAIRTYERGVEDETLSCGTGATAVAIAMHHLGKTKQQKVTINVQGGQLEVRFHPSDKSYRAIDLIGPATFVYQGQWKI